MKINYFSDLHLEFGPQAMPANDAELVIAAGDIGLHHQGCEWLKSLGKPVIYVAGNHEFYDREHQQALVELQQVCADSSVNFLEQAVWVYRDIRFIGCTLWADIYSNGPETAEKLNHRLNDFKKISYQNQAFNMEQFRDLNHCATAWLREVLTASFPGKTVVITHHAPSEWSWDKSPRMTKKFAYCTDLKALMHEYDIDAWFHGHIHSVVDYRIADTRILCNPRGYYPNKLVEQFDINKCIEL
ncbi:MAG: metallophosphoesterase [Methylococcales bacterium]|nr:metallophosphoesterase [Methylococcales bacterium]